MSRTHRHTQKRPGNLPNDSHEDFHHFSNIVTEATYHDYGVYFTTDGKRRDLVICDSNPTKTPLYFAQMVESKKNKPDIRLYAAQHTSLDSDVNNDGAKLKSKQAKNGQVLAVAHFPAFSGKAHMGFGLPERPDSVQWETIKRTKIGVYDFSIPCPQKEQYSNKFSCNVEEAAILHGQDKKFQWCRTHSTADGLDNPAYARNLSAANYKLVNDRGDVVALFISNGMKSWNKRGRLRIFKDKLRDLSSCASKIEREVEVRIILTHCVIEEKARR